MHLLYTFLTHSLHILDTFKASQGFPSATFPSVALKHFGRQRGFLEGCLSRVGAVYIRAAGKIVFHSSETPESRLKLLNVSRYGDYSLFLPGLTHVYLSNQRPLSLLLLVLSFLVPTVGQARRCPCSLVLSFHRTTPVTQRQAILTTFFIRG